MLSPVPKSSAKFNRSPSSLRKDFRTMNQLEEVFHLNQSLQDKVKLT
jgi:hypothetical protein